MSRNNEIIIDDYSIYIEKLDQVDDSIQYHDAGGNKAINWATDEIERAIKPTISIWNSIRKAAEEIMPNEMELSMQFQLCLKGETPVLKIVSAESSAQIAVKFTWKKDEDLVN